MTPNDSNQPVPIDDINKALIAQSEMLMMRYIPGGEPAAPAAQPGFEISKRSLFYVLFRHPFKILACFALFTMAAVVYVKGQPNLFVSEALIRIRGLRNNMTIDPAAGDTPLLKSVQADLSQMSVEADVIMSDALLMRVVDNVGPEKILGKPRPARAKSPGLRDRVYEILNFDRTVPNSRQAALMTLRGSLDVTASGDSRELLRLTYKAKQPERAQAVLAAIVEEYENYQIAGNRTRFSPEFFKSRANEVRKRLEEAQAELDAERQRLNIMMPETEKEMLLTQKGAIDGALMEAASQASAANETIRVLDRFARHYGVGKTQGGVRMANPVAQDMQRKMVEMQMEESKLAARYSDTHPKLIDIRSQMESLKKALKAAESNPEPDAMSMLAGLNNPQFELDMRTETARADQAAMDAKTRMLLAQRAAVEKQLDNLLEHETALNDLEDKVDRLRIEHKQYVASQQAAEIARTLDKDSISNIAIDQPATLPFLSTKSQRKMFSLLALGMFVGLCAGVGWAFMLEYTDHTVRNRADVEALLGQPVLMAIPAARRHVLFLEGK